MDLFNKIKVNEEPTVKLAHQLHGYFTYPKLEGPVGPKMKFRGREVLNWNTSDYLGLSRNTEISKFDKDNINKYGIGFPVGNRVISGHTSLHEKLESALAELTDKEDAFVLNFAYQGFMSVIDSICSRNDIIIYDSLIHESIIDGIRLTLSKHIAFRHNDVDNLEKQLNKASGIAKETNGGILVAVNGIYNSTGEYAKLSKIAALKKKYEFRLLIDDADGFGVEGTNGAGTDNKFKINKKVDLYLGSFSKAIAAIGGFVSGPANIINHMRYHARSQVHSKALPAIYAAGTLDRIKYIAKHPELSVKLHEKVSYMRHKLKSRKFNLGKADACIIPVHFNCTIYQTVNLIIDLRENYNIFCPVLVFPFVEKDKLVLKFQPSVLHTKEDIDFTIDVLSEIRKSLKNKKYDGNPDFFDEI